MHEPVPGLVVAPATTDADLEAMAYVRGRVNPLGTLPRVENLRHHRDSTPDLAYVVARVDGEPAGCACVQPTPADYAAADVSVVPEVRGRGVGSALLAAVSARAREHGKEQLQGEVREDDDASLAWLTRRGFRAVGGEQAVALDLAAAPAPVSPPPGVEIVSRAERPDLLEGMYEVAREADEDIPGSPGVRTFEEWRVLEIDRPTRLGEFCFVAVAGDEVVGYAALDVPGTTVYHALTAVRRSWRRRGVATALKHAEIAAAKRAGFRRLVTGSEERNLPMRRLNEKLGYRPEPSLSAVVVRGPLVLRG
jgi:GNAT superfamily N-acetyltransferase